MIILNFKSMIINYIKQKKLTINNNFYNNNNKITDVMKITIIDENCYIKSAEILSIKSFSNELIMKLKLQDLKKM